MPGGYLDPEKYGADGLGNVSSDYESTSDNETQGREHYVETGRSKLRDQLGVEVDDVKYQGKKVKRNELFNEEFGLGSSDGEEQSGEEDISDESMSEQEEEESSSEDEDDKDSNEKEKEDDWIANQIKELKEEEEQERVPLMEQRISDSEKGKHVRNQMAVYENLLDMRIRFQKVFVALNAPADTLAIEQDTAAEVGESLLSLVQELGQLRSSLLKRNEIDSSLSYECPEEPAWSVIESWQKGLVPVASKVIDKWNQKTQLKSINIQTQIANKKMKMSNGIYEDSDFYHHLLKDLIDSKAASNDSNELSLKYLRLKQLQQETKKKKQVDTKASKGRKIRYTVHEKLQNFMAPIPDNSWHEEMKAELFASLFGVSEASASTSVQQSQKQVVPLDGFRLFA